MHRDIIFSISLLFALFAHTATRAQDSPAAALLQDKSLAAGNLHPYRAPESIRDTPPPKGFKPFYISYYGRHGSRYHTGSSKFVPGYGEKLDWLHSEGALSTEGEKLRSAVKDAYKKHEDRFGDLSDRGFEEGRSIGYRFGKRYPGLFRQKGRDSIRFRGSPILRSTLTGAAFLSGLQKSHPGIKVNGRSGERYYFTRWTANPRLDKIYKAVSDSVLKADFDSAAFCRRMFTDNDKAAKVFADKGIARSFREMMFILSILPCIDPDADPFAIFTDSETLAYAKTQNIYAAATFIHTKEGGEFRDKDAGAPLLRNIVEWADEAIAGNGICADLRFGHDSGVGPLFSLLYIKGYDRVSSLVDSFETWPAWDHLFMGSNACFVFYRNSRGEVLVKVLENERETRIPLLSPYSGPYYRWQDFRDYCIRRI